MWAMSLIGLSEGISHALLQTTNPNGHCLYDRTVRSCWCTEVEEE